MAYTPIINNINTASDLKTYIKTALGEPVITVNVSDDQLDLAIDKALAFCQTWHSYFNYETYRVIKITQQHVNDGFIPIPDDITTIDEVLRFNKGFASNYFSAMASTNMFIPANNHTSISINDWIVLSINANFIRDALLGEATFSYSPIERRLYIWQEEIMNVDNHVAIKAKCYANPHAPQWDSVFNNQQLKDLATAYTKKIWGGNLSKFGGTSLLGGIDISTTGDRLINEANTEIQEIEQSIKDTFGQGRYGAFFVG